MYHLKWQTVSELSLKHHVPVVRIMNDDKAAKDIHSSIHYIAYPCPDHPRGDEDIYR